MLTTTFNLLHRAGACYSRYRHLAKNLGGLNQYGADTPITLVVILESNGPDDALWCLRCCQDQLAADKLALLLAADYAEHVLHIFERKYLEDLRPRNAIKAAREFARGAITAAAWAAAWDAAGAATRDAAGTAAWAAARAAAGTAAGAAARAAAGTAAWAAAGTAARAAAWDAAWAAAWDAAGAAARDAAWAAERQWQTERFREVLNS